MADITASLIPALSTATNQNKIYWVAHGGGHRCTVLHWQLFVVRTGDSVNFQIIDDSGTAVASQDVDSPGARNLHDNILAQQGLGVAIDDVSLTQFLGVLGSF